MIQRIQFHHATATRWWMGRAYVDYCRQQTVLAPIPLNWAIWAALRVWLFLRKPPYIQITRSDEYQRGFEDGQNRMQQYYEPYAGRKSA